jgi:hypothetical protein
MCFFDLSVVDRGWRKEKRDGSATLSKDLGQQFGKRLII